MQAYMVAEPWNTRAIQGNLGVGFTFVQGKEVWLGHPDRLLGVMESFIDENPKTYTRWLRQWWKLVSIAATRKIAMKYRRC